MKKTKPQGNNDLSEESLFSSEIVESTDVATDLSWNTAGGHTTTPLSLSSSVYFPFGVMHSGIYNRRYRHVLVSWNMLCSSSGQKKSL